MAKRLTDTDIWDKEWFMKLPPKNKCLVKFIRDKCDLAGVWCPNWTLAKMYVGEPVSEKELLEIDGGKQFAKLPSGKIFCIDFISFQNGKLENKSPIHIKILSLLENHNIPYPYPINGVCNTPVVEVVVEEEVKVGLEVKVSSGENLIFPYSSVNFLQTWNVLIKEKKWKKKSFAAFQAALKKLGEYPESEAIEMMENTIAGEWQGIFEIKPKNTNGKQNNIGTKAGQQHPLQHLDDIANGLLRGVAGNNS